MKATEGREVEDYSGIYLAKRIYSCALTLINFCLLVSLIVFAFVQHVVQNQA